MKRAFDKQSYMKSNLCISYFMFGCIVTKVLVPRKLCKELFLWVWYFNFSISPTNDFLGNDKFYSQFGPNSCSAAFD